MNFSGFRPCRPQSPWMLACASALGLVLAFGAMPRAEAQAATRAQAPGAANSSRANEPPASTAASPAQAASSTRAEQSIEDLEKTYQQSRDSFETFLHFIEVAFLLLGAALGAAGVRNWVVMSEVRKEIAAHTKSLDQQKELIRRVVRAQTGKMTSQIAAFDEKMEKFRQQVQGVGRTAEAYAHAAHAFVYRANKFLPKAVEALTDAIKLRNDDPFLYWQRAYVLGDLRQYQAAIADCETALNLDKTFVEARQLRGYYHLLLKHYATAQQDLAAALQGSPDDGYSIMNLALAYGGQKNKTEALRLLRRLATTPDGPELLPKARSIAEFQFLDQDPDFQALTSDKPKTPNAGGITNA